MEGGPLLDHKLRCAAKGTNIPLRDLTPTHDFFQYGKDGTPFKVSTPRRWLVFITNPKVLRELKDSEENLSFTDAIKEVKITTISCNVILT